MLSQKDLDKIREIVKEVVKEENTIREVTVERTNKETGAKELKTIDLYIPEWIAAELPELAGALRGVQETSDNVKNNFGKLARAVRISMEDLGEKIVKQLNQDAEVIKIESDT
jgi:hypothetical protein